MGLYDQESELPLTPSAGDDTSISGPQVGTMFNPNARRARQRPPSFMDQQLATQPGAMPPPLPGFPGAPPAAPGFPGAAPGAAPAAPAAAGAAAPGMTPERELALLTIGQAPYGQKERDLASQMQMADELRKTATPGMRGNSRIMVAANPLEHLNTGVRSAMGEMQRRDIEKQRSAMFDERLGDLRKQMGLPPIERAAPAAPSSEGMGFMDKLRGWFGGGGA